MAGIAEKLQDNLEGSFRRIIDFGGATPSSKGEVAVCCPVHDDTEGSLRINILNGKWKCFGCSDDEGDKAGGVSPVSLFCFLHKTDWQDACQELEAMFGYRKTPQYDVNKYHQDLLSSEVAMKSLFDRGLSKEVIQHFKLGLRDSRVCLPEYDLGGTLRQVIAHDTMKVFEPKYKSLSILQNVGVRLWPMQNLRKHKKIVYILEGWLDALLAIMCGLNAVSITGSGANSWNDKFNKYFKGKDVYICYDADAPGEKAGNKLANKLSGVANKVYNIRLAGDKLPAKADFTDYIREYGIDKFLDIDTQPWVYKGGKDDIIQDIPLNETNKAEHYGKRIKTTAVVTGTSFLYQLPKTIDAKCSPGSCGDSCAGCTLNLYNGNLTVGVDPDDKDLLNFIGVSDDAVQSVIRTKKLGIPKKCFAVEISISQVQNLQELVIVSSIDFNEHSSGYDRRSAYALTDNKFEAGRPYIMQAMNLPSPKNQLSSLLVYDAVPTNDNIDNFKMTPDIKRQLNIFQAHNLEDMRAVRRRRYKDYEKITQIYGRAPLFFGLELCAFSALTFTFRGRHVKRGYVNMLGFGDTRTGKSESAEKLMQHWRAGDSTSAENLSFAGLIGGLHQMNGTNWTVDWGLVVLNDRRMLKIDEFHEMNSEEFGRTSETISSGVATIHKIGKERAMARCRMMFLSNTKEDEPLSSYRFPVEAVKSIMGGAPEDIARLDFAIGVSELDVPAEVKDQALSTEPIEFTSDICHNLIMWAWSRKNEDIVFTKEAEDIILELSNKLLEIYHTKLPLIVKGEQPIKLARLAVACAILHFSTDPLGQKVIVRDIHVQMVFDYLNTIYKMPGSKYYQYSKFLKDRETLRFIDQLKQLPWTDVVKSHFLATKYIRPKHISQWFVLRDPSEGYAMFNTLFQSNCLEPYANNQYKKTEAFVHWLNSNEFGTQNFTALASHFNF